MPESLPEPAVAPRLAAFALLLLPLLVVATPAYAQSGERHRLGGEVTVPPPIDVPYPQIVDPARHVPGSVSLGTTSDGHLANPRHLPDESEVHYVLPQHRARDTHHGTDEMLALIRDAANAVHARHGTRIGLGNISAPRGGDITWSRSHNAGRDADIAFPFVDAEGRPVEVETLVPVDRNGTARDGSGRRFDPETAWTLVAAMLESDEAQVQWIFVYDPIKEAILQHAIDVGADGALVALAADVLHQPGDSAPHDDHFHVRIYCARDREPACRDAAPRWPWIDARGRAEPLR